ncbi:MAG: peroxiredoxin family protein [Phycisphaerae bacterium]
MSRTRTEIPFPRRWIRVSRWVGVAVLAAGLGAAAGPPHIPEKVPDGLGESEIIEMLKELRTDHALLRDVRLRRMLRYADALVRRYPDSSFREDAQLLKLTALSGLAATEAYYVPSLLEATQSIAREAPAGRLADENAFFAIQAFVYGARLEAMPKERMLAGIKERYEAFLVDHPESPRVPLIMGSLVRNAIRREKMDEARTWVDRMESAFPGERITQRAAGELRRTQSLNKPFTIEYTGNAGPPIKTADYKGKVVVFHLWTAWTDKGVASLNPMARLYKSRGSESLQLLSLNLDRDSSRAKNLVEMKHLPWPQSFDKLGLQSDIALAYGILRLPICFVIDQAGVLRFVGDADQLVEQATGLLRKGP